MSELPRLSVEWLAAAPWALVAGIAVVGIVAVVFLVAILVRGPLAGRLAGLRSPRDPWGHCSDCGHATPPNALRCAHCGMQLRPAHRDTFFDA